MWLFSRKDRSGFSSNSTAEEVTQGINAAGLTAIVTGGSSGIGEETSRVLALRGAHVILAVRNTAAGRTSKEKILKQTPTAKVDVMELDLSSIGSVKNFASQFKSTGLPLNLLINNAGISMVPYNLSVDGIELQFATNYVGHFLLTNLLLDTMKETSRRSNVEGRILNITSTAHFTFHKEGICFEKLSDKARYTGYGRFSAYRVSKLANILHANELSRRLREEGANVTANSLHPGVVTTKIVDHLLFRSSVINRGRNNMLCCIASASKGNQRRILLGL
uniref:Short-chain dehydrogenase TIC 32, chloroplastic-like n=1 Tax=Kalanchoe fedtschenkoi TaxID=63787 RepID=A0A7N1A023_KALFE